ncbi:MAG: gliding motility-associated C-terminal domain-containing protein, partial [Saprospiraceae bacterium]|nr:gliding motility-associated C-terminal domain-containing protein [Saprospiraceae bacterium]
TVLDAGMGYTNYQWSDMSADQTINVNAPGTYSLTVSDASGCQGTATVDVIENTLPQPIIGGETQFCEGTQTSLSVDSGFATYDWSNGDQDFETEIMQAGMVTVAVTDANGCENTAAINIIELANPQPQITGNTGFCAGESTTLTTSENYDSYLWSDMSTDASFVANQAGFYDVTVEDMNGCQGTTSIEVVEFATPMPQIQGVLEICEGENTTLSLDAAYASYAWSTNEATASVAIDMAGVVEVVVTDVNGCTGTTSEEIIVNPIPEVMISGLDYFCTNASTDIMVEGSFNAYNWSNNEMTPGITVDMPGEYTVEVEDAAGCLGTASIMVEEIALPQADPGMLQTIDCAQETVTIGGMGTSQGNYSYTWTGPGIDANNENEYQPIVDQEGTYTLVVEDLDFGCISTMEEVLVEDVRYEPVIELAVAEILDCDTESTEINSNGSTSGASIVYEWYNESGDLVSNDLNYLADEPGTYTLVIIDELTSCTNSSMIEVEQDISEPVVDAGDEQGIDCDTPEATLDGSDSQSGANIVYEWFSESGTGIVGDNTQPVITVNEAGSYTLIVTNQSNGCTSEQSVAVNGDFEPPIANAGADQTLDCFSTLVTLDGSASTIGSNISYTWTDDNGTEISTNASLEVDNEGTYQLTVLNNENGCTAQDEVIVLQNEEDLNAFGTIVDGPTCFGDDDASILIVDIEGGEEPFLYNLNGGAYTVSPDFDDLTAGTYEVGVQDATGCEVLTEIVIEDGNDLNVNLGEDMTIQLGEEINVQAEVSIPRGEIELIDWMTSDSSGCEDCLLFEVSPFVTSQYTVTVIDSNGCVASDVLTIFVDARDEIFMPTVFSPNGDDQNDYFTIYGGADVLNIRTLNIFDRWGNLMFAGEGLAPNNELEGWDGNFKGQPQNTGVYIFMAEVEFLDGTVKLFKGDVLLMR